MWEVPSCTVLDFKKGLTAASIVMFMMENIVCDGRMHVFIWALNGIETERWWEEIYELMNDMSTYA